MGPKFGGAIEKCSRCGTTVYAAERIGACSSQWHKKCFRCKTCNTTLTLGTYKDQDGEIYCKGCFADKLLPHDRNRKQAEEEMKASKQL
ncbi:hypothetical protein GJ496_007882 [Pomphorhynchus laevis]|nr:hypothetical protein GJ496_007882 [Pomphorhynchus laevis]